MQDKVSALSIKEFVYESTDIPEPDRRDKNFPFKNRRLNNRIPVCIRCSVVFFKCDIPVVFYEFNMYSVQLAVKTQLIFCTVCTMYIYIVHTVQ